MPDVTPQAVDAVPAAVPVVNVAPAAEAKPRPAAKQPCAPAAKAASPASAARLGDLPPFTRSLLHIRVPVVVTLAEKRQPLGRIIELGPGSIIQFEKSCEEMLQLSVADHAIACGEAVKVGDKFGLRITSITPPQERFHAVRPKGNDQ
jgi:flagellar motor switch/type III secretory pathway protein FliN